ncbi:hypothetical protein CDD82_145 [Ophiocordyceps australis]|uniref:CFEM domain-containing protein n=1 Tax=Ophiocordyceps australis TaxID=1399860 RepID=A0A2C5ZPE6_9HYPO|nr:hypothetical protein CDD82_145 [Ophiocordyceps australis]
MKWLGLVFLVAMTTIVSALSIPSPPAIWTYGPNKNFTREWRKHPGSSKRPNPPTEKTRTPDFSEIDPAAFECLTMAIRYHTNCRITDIKCACDNAQTLRKTAKKCILEKCGFIKALRVASQLKKICKKEGVDWDEVEKEAKKRDKESKKAAKKLEKIREKMLIREIV